MNLRNSDVALIDDEQKILREIIQQAEGTASRRTSVKIARIILHARAVTYFLDHFQVVSHSFLDACCFLGFANALEIIDLLAQIQCNFVHGTIHTVLRGRKYVGRTDYVAIHTLKCMTGHNI